MTTPTPRVANRGFALVTLCVALSASVIAIDDTRLPAQAAPLLTTTPSPFPCPVATSELLRVGPVTSPWLGATQPISVSMGNIEVFTVSSSVGLSVSRPIAIGEPSVNGFYTASMPLLLGRNELTVTAKVRRSVVAGCVFGDYTLRNNQPLAIERVCPPIAPLDTTIRVEPIVSRTIAYTQVLSVGVIAASSVTATVQGQTRTAVFAGTPGEPGFVIPIDLRAAGASPAATGDYTITVHAYWAERGDPACGLGAIAEQTTVDRNGAPLVVRLEPAVCPAVASLPPRVYPITSPWPALTQTIRGEHSSITTRVLVSATTGLFTATLGVTSTWSAEINLALGITNTLSVYGIDFADTQCESRVGPIETDINGAPLRIAQSSRARAWLPVTARGAAAR
jgi:hypothetical protein